MTLYTKTYAIKHTLTLNVKIGTIILLVTQRYAVLDSGAREKQNL